jgi:hypothetical protein
MCKETASHTVSTRTLYTTSPTAFMGLVWQIARAPAALRTMLYCDFWPRGNKVASGAD